MSSFIEPTTAEREFIFGRAAEGKTPLEIADEMDVRRDRWSAARWVERVLHRCDTHIDEVALKRAAQGDRRVYRRLTPAERAEFVRRSEALFAEERWRNSVPGISRGPATDSKTLLLGLLGVSDSHWRTLVERARDERMV
jgi:hypothetical protein